MEQRRAEVWRTASGYDTGTRHMHVHMCVLAIREVLHCTERSLHPRQRAHVELEGHLECNSENSHTHFFPLSCVSIA